MPLSKGKLALISVLLIASLYLVFFHTPPLPLNHEAVGLGTNHLLHSIFGVILAIISGLLWFTGRKGKK